MAKIITKTCVGCSSEYKTYRDVSRYCGLPCYRKSQEFSENSGRFKRGSVPANKNSRQIACPTCSKSFSVPSSRVLRTKNPACSKICASEAMKRRGAGDKILDLHLKGWRPSEIAEEIGVKLPTVYSAINRRRYRLRVTGVSRGAIKRRVLTGSACVVCGWSRCIDVAHIIPAKDGGTMDVSNLMPLCPNHHHLYDYGGLTVDEVAKIEEYKNASSKQGAK